MATDLEPFRRSVVRILDPDGRFFGLGLKVGDALVMTCAHVVAAALRADARAPTAPEGSVGIQSPVAGMDGATVGARVIAGGWWPKAQAGQRLADMCVLALETAVPATSLVSITDALSLTGIRCMLLGAPSAHREDLVPITGQVGERNASGRYVLKQDSGYLIEPGCSGAPVCDKATGQVVGMVVQDEQDETLRIAFLIPAEDMAMALNACLTHARSAATRSLQPVRRWVERCVARLDPALGSQFKQYVDAYAGNPAAPLPFVGRAEALAEVGHAIASAGVTCVIGGAGSGKSAFLLHLARAIIDDQDEVLLFLPVSIRFNTADELRGLRLLYLQLGNLFAQLRFGDESTLDPDDYRERIARGWEFIANQAPRRFVLIVDATDEASGAWIEDGVLPYELPYNLSLVVSTRTAPLQGAPAWLQPQRRPDGSLAPSHVMALPALSLDALREAVEQLGDPYGTFLYDDAAMRELYRLTDHGDPLLVSLWVGQLRQFQDRAQPPGLLHLRSLAPGFEGFLKLWFNEQQRLWKAQGRALSREQFEPLLYLFSWAAGPIAARDIAELAAILQLEGFTDVRDLQPLLDGALRLLVRSGDDGALAFVHPRLGYHYRELLEQQPAHKQSIGDAFLNWGRRKIAALGAAQGSHADCPAYLLNHYTQHVKDAGLDAVRALDDYLLPLIWQPFWRQAWLEAEGSYAGFLSDIARIETFIEQAGPAYLPDLLHCCLCRAGVRSSTGRIPAKLIGQLVAANLWSSARALRTIGLLVDTHNQIEALVTVASLAGKAGERLLERALDIACAEPGPRERAAALALVIPALRGMPALLERTLHEITAMYDGGHKDSLLAACVPSLVGHDALLARALAQQALPDDRHDRTQVLARLAKEIHSRPQLYSFALAHAATEADEEARLGILIAAARHVPAEATMVTPILDLIESFDGKRHYCQALQALAHVLRELPAMLERTLAHIAALDEQWRCWALQSLLPALSAGLLQPRAAQLFTDLSGRGDWIALFAELLPVIRSERAAPALMRQAIGALADPVARAQALLIAGSELDACASDDELDASLRTLLAIPGEAPRCRALNVVLTRCTPRARLAETLVDRLGHVDDDTLRGELIARLVRQCRLDDAALLHLADLAGVLEDGLQRDLLAGLLVERMYGWPHLREQADRLAGWIGDDATRLRTALLRASLHPAGRASILADEIDRLRSIEQRDQRIALARMLIPAVAHDAALRARWIDTLGPLDQDEVLLALVGLAQACENGGPGAELFHQVIACAIAEDYPGTAPGSVLTEVAGAAAAHQDVLLRVFDCLDPSSDFTALYCNVARHARHHPAVFERLLEILGAMQFPADELLVSMAEAVRNDSALLAKVLAARSRFEEPGSAGRIAFLDGIDRPNLRRLLEMAQSIGDGVLCDKARMTLVCLAALSPGPAARTLAALDGLPPAWPRYALKARLAPALDEATRRTLLLDMLAAVEQDGRWQHVGLLIDILRATPVDRFLLERFAASCDTDEHGTATGQLMAAINRAVSADLVDDALAFTLGLRNAAARGIALTGLVARDPAPAALVARIAALLPSLDVSEGVLIAGALADAAGEHKVGLPLDTLLAIAPLLDESSRFRFLRQIAPLLGGDTPAWRRYARLAVSLPRSYERDALLEHYVRSWFDGPGALRSLVRHVQLLWYGRDEAWGIVEPVLDAAIARHPGEAELERWAAALLRVREYKSGNETFRKALYRLQDVPDAALSLARRHLPEGVDPRLWDLFEARIRAEAPNHFNDLMDRAWDTLPLARQLATTVSVRAAVTVFLWRLAAPSQNRPAYAGMLRLLDPAKPGTAQRLRRIDPPSDAIVDYWIAAAQNTTGPRRERYLRRAVDEMAELAFHRNKGTALEPVAKLSMLPGRLTIHAFSRRSGISRHIIWAKVGFLEQLKKWLTPLAVLSNLLAGCRRGGQSGWIFAWGMANGLELNPYMGYEVPRDIPAVPMADGVACAERLLALPDNPLDDHARDTILCAAVENLPPGHALVRYLHARAENINDQRMRFVALLRLLRRPESLCRLPALDAALQLAALQLAPVPYTEALADMLSLTGADPEALRRICASIGSASVQLLQPVGSLPKALADAIAAIPQGSVRAEMCRRLTQAMHQRPRPVVLDFLIPALAGPLASLGSDDALARALASVDCTAAWWP